MIDKLLVSLGLKYVAAKLDGKKAYIGAVGKMLAGLATIITGVVGLLGGLFPDSGLPAIDQEPAIGTIMAGVYAISSGFEGLGQRHAIEKSSEVK